MKNLAVSMLAMASIAAMVSCSSNNDPVDEVGNGEKVEIKLNAGVGAITTKATPLTELKNNNITLLRQDRSSTPSSWASYTVGKYTVGADGSIPLTGDQKYYNNDETPLNSYFLGVYPQIATDPTSNIITFSGQTGEEDILCSQVYDAGTKILQTDATNSKMKFDHMLSQVQIKLVATASAKTAFGKIKKIIIKDMPKTLDLSLDNRAITASNTPNNADITIYDNSTGENIDAITIPAKFLLPGLGGENATDLKIAIETEKYNTGATQSINILGIKTNVSGTDKYGTLAGYLHNIELTFNDNISITTEVSSIQNGGSGNGNIEN
ncbi:fimbrillin family protein [Parabacteroides sp. APC149_11_2_Y6]